MKRLAIASGLFLVAVTTLAAWTPAPPAPAWVGPRVLAAPPEGANVSLVELERMENEALRDSLAWLAKRQEEDGHWEATAAPGHPLEKLYEPNAAKECDVMATSLAILAYVGAGNTPWSGPYREVVKQANIWLAKQLQENGCLLAWKEEAAESLTERERAARRATVARLNHLWGTIALLEVVASAEVIDPGASVTDAEKLKRRNEQLPFALKALQFVTLDPSEKPKAFDFLDEQAVTMDELALVGTLRHIGGQNRVTHDKDFFGNEGAIARVDKLKKGMPELWWPSRYTDEGEYWFRGMIATPQAMILHFYLRIPNTRRMMDMTAPLLHAHPPVWNPYYTVDRPTPHPSAGQETGTAQLPSDLKRLAGTWKDEIANEASWFWQGMAFRSMGGEDWNVWRAAFVPVACAHQRRGGPECGSWDPAGPHARVFGREIATALLSITLESKCKLQMARTNWQELKPDPRTAARAENLAGQKNERVKCAVCGIDTTTTTVFSKGRGADIYYFCSDECAHKFEMDPTPYLKGAENPNGGGEGMEGSHK